jgi:adenine phosphoribosyltransferase
MDKKAIKDTVRIIKDFPKIGINFLDITTTLNDRKCFRSTIDLMAEMAANKKIDKIIGIDARGFIFASALVYKLDCGLVLARKKGKLPYRTHSRSYGLEYGEASLEMHADAVLPGENVLVVDDILATGGTAEATKALVRESGGNLVGFLFFGEIIELNGRARLGGSPTSALLEF